MPNYDFSNLSPIDFEDLARDLLQAETGNRHETFKAGKDLGIDIRCLSSGQNIIVQCKHYYRSGFSKLKSSLNEELEKLKKLKPESYWLVTSLPLSPSNKKELKELMLPYIKSEEQILGKECVNNLLGRYPQVERSHFKLWICSTNVLETVLHKGVHNCTVHLKEKLEVERKLFVINDSLDIAMEKLKRERFIIISGNPGVGKTFLSHMLLIKFLKDEYRLVEVSSPEDAYNLFDPKQKTIFFFDDFLGMTRLGDNFSSEKANEIVKLVDIVRKSQNSRIILTSRKYLISQAVQCSERFANADLLSREQIVKLEDYTKPLRARILFNHLFFSELPKEFIDSLLISRAYHEIVDHPNYVPRVIELISRFEVSKETDSSGYPQYCFSVLDEPEKAWKHPYREVSTGAKNTLITLLFMGSKSSASCLEKAFLSFHKGYCHFYNEVFSPEDFESAQKELLGSFLNVDENVIEFQNPGIQDFMVSNASKNLDLIFLIVKTSIYFEQLKFLWDFVVEQGKIEEFLEHECWNDFVNAMDKFKCKNNLDVEKRNYLSRVSFLCSIYKKTSCERFLRMANETILFFQALPQYKRGEVWQEIDLLIEVDKLLQDSALEEEVLDTLKESTAESVGRINQIGDFAAYKRAADRGLVGERSIQVVRAKFQGYIGEELLHECECLPASSSVEGLLEDLQLSGDWLKVDYNNTKAEITQIYHERLDGEEELADLEFEERRIEAHIDRESSLGEKEMIDDMFEGLNER